MTLRGLDLAGRLASVAALGLAILWAFPLAYALSAAMSGGDGVSIDGVGSYLRALTGTAVGRWYLNSLVTSAAVTAGVLAISAPCGFALSQLEFRGRRALWWLVLGSFLIPAQALIVNHFLLMNRWGLINTWAGTVLPQLIAPVAVIVYKRFFDAVPPDLREAAALDGAGPWQVLLRIYLPLNRGVTVALGLVVFIGAWNAFLWPFLVVTRPEMMTITVAIAQAQDIWDVGGLAAALLAGLPVALLYLLLQRRVAEAVVLSAGLGVARPAPADDPPVGPAPRRDLGLDLLKAALVAALIAAQVVQLLAWAPGPWLRLASDLVSLAALPGLLLALGLGLGQGAQREARQGAVARPRAARLHAAGALLLAAWASSFAGILLVEREPITARLALDVLSARVLVGWSEVLTTLALASLLAALARPLLLAVARRGDLLVAAGVACLSTTLLTTDRAWPFAAAVIGRTDQVGVPLLPWLPWLLVGIRLGLRGRPPGGGDILLGLAATGAFALAWVTGGDLPGRSPPSAAWILGPGLALALAVRAAGRLAPRVPRPGLVLAAGRHVPAALLLSNLAIFTVRALWHRPLHGGLAVAGVAAALVAAVTLWGLALDRRRARPA